MTHDPSDGIPCLTPAEWQAREDARVAAMVAFEEMGSTSPQRRYRRVICHERDEVFDIDEAVEQFKTTRSNLTKACNSGRKCRGYHWRMEGEKQRITLRPKPRRWLPVRVLPCGQCFENAEQAAKFTGDSPNTVKYCLSRPHTTKRGYQYQRIFGEGWKGEAA